MKEPGMNPALVRGATSRYLGDPGAIGVSCVSAMPDIRKLSCPCGAGAAHLISYLYRGAARTRNIDLILLVDLVASTTGLPMENPGWCNSRGLSFNSRNALPYQICESSGSACGDGDDGRASVSARDQLGVGWKAPAAMMMAP
jgi:hypothetical protein